MTALTGGPTRATRAPLGGLAGGALRAQGDADPGAEDRQDGDDLADEDRQGIGCTPL